MFELSINGILVGQLPTRSKGGYKEGDIIFILYGDKNGTFQIKSINTEGLISVSPVDNNQKPQYQVCAEMYHRMTRVVEVAAV